jgi:enoyl-CoA hydratase
VLPRALDLAGRIASASPLVVRQLRVSLAESATRDLESQLDLEAANQAVNYGTDDLREGLAAGRERRAPDFTGH